MARNPTDADVLHEVRTLRCEEAVRANHAQEQFILIQVRFTRLETLLGQIIALLTISKPTQPTFAGGGLMYVVKNDNPDIGYHITAPDVTDAEGEPVPAENLVYETSSDNPTTVEMIPTDTLNGTVHFGASGQANVNVNVKNTAGTLLGAFGAQFTVTTGDAAAIVGGTITFDGLTES